MAVSVVNYVPPEEVLREYPMRRIPGGLYRNTGIKTVPRPVEKPSVVVKKMAMTTTAVKPQPSSVHVSQAKKTDYKKLGLYALGAVIAYLVLKKILRW